MGIETVDIPSKRIALIIATMTSFIPPFMSSSINIALPSIGKEFSLNTALLGWVPTSFLLAITIFLVPMGRIADIYGRKRLFTYGVIVYAVFSFLGALSMSAISLIASRVLQGIGGAMMLSTGVAILTSAFGIGERGRALGINAAAIYTGLSAGPALGGFMTQQFGWRSIFLVNVFVSLAILIIVLWKFKGEWVEAKGEKFDLIGSVIYGVALSAIIAGLSTLPVLLGIWLILIGIIGLVMFNIWEVRVESPILNMNLFKNNIAFSLSNLAALINYSVTFGTTFLLSLYLQYLKDFNPLNTGLILVSQPIIMSILSPITGRLSDRIEPRVIASIGMALTTVGVLLLVFLSQDTGIDFIIISLVILGLGFALFSSPNTNAVMSSVGKKFYGVASGTLGTMRHLGQTLSLGIVMLLFSLYVGKVQITPEYYPLFLKTLNIAFIIFSAICFLGIFASLCRGKIR